MILKLTTVHHEHAAHGPGRVIQRELFFQTATFESIEETPHPDMPGGTHLRSTSGGCWDLEESDAEKLASVIVYVNEVPLPIGTSKGMITVEQVNEVMRKDCEAERALIGVPKETTLDEVEEVLSMAWTDASNLPASDAK